MPTVSATSDEIIRCARALIISGGYNSFSYADIAEVVGIRKASIHHHFPTKLDLVRTLVRRYREEVDAGFAEFARSLPEPMDQLRAYIGYWASCIDDPATAFCVCALLATEIPVLPPEIELEVKRHFEALSRWLAATLERGDEGSIALTDTARSEAETFMATVHGAMLSARAYGDSQVFGAITKDLLKRLAPQQ